MNSLLKSVRLLSLSKELALKTSSFHSSAVLDKKWNQRSNGPSKWLQHNKTVFPPQEPHEEPRKAVSFGYQSVNYNHSIHSVCSAPESKHQVFAREDVVCCLHGSWSLRR